MHSSSLVFLLFFSLLSLSSFAQTVVFPGNERDDYFFEVLKLALSYSPNKDYQLQFYNKHLPKVRVFESIITDKKIDIIAAGATIDREKILLPIRFPLVKGLFGWRIPLVNKKNIDLFLPQLSSEDFKKITVGQLHTWSDTKILESNDLQVKKGSHYQGLFHMLVAERFQYFPRSVLEIQGEFETHKKLDIAIDPHILIHYPAAYVFYVNQSNTVLADDVNYGLEQSLKDGSFDKLFDKYFGNIVKKLTLEKRRTYQLQNPFLPNKIPLHRKALWIDFTTREVVTL